jgi:hypothetical protein
MNQGPSGEDDSPPSDLLRNQTEEASSVESREEDAPITTEIDPYQIPETLGFYPDLEDPQFIARLLTKTEFAETRSKPFDASGNPCAGGQEFEITPVQRFIANFMHPRTPYMSCLLYHGVGVGKTCAAIQAAEAYLDMYPKRKVIIVCPRAIRAGFERTLFDAENLTLGTNSVPNSAIGCTGSTYLRLADCLMERNTSLIEYRVKRAISRRYAFFGYGEFANYIRQVIQSVGDVGSNNTQKKAQAIHKEFSYRMVIIDEAHNIRDVAGTATQKDQEEDIDTMGDQDDRKGAKMLTPFLLDLLQLSDGIKLLLMTATPMFNSVFEIVFLLNLMLLNEKVPQINSSDILTETGTPSAKASETLKRIANGRVSFMRGENPNSFPLRLSPDPVDRAGVSIPRLTVDTYPTLALTRTMEKKVSRGNPIDDADQMATLPIVVSTNPDPAAPFNTQLRAATIDRVKEKGTGYQILDALLQSGNCLFPTFDSTSSNTPTKGRFGRSGFDSCFSKDVKGIFTALNGSWLVASEFSKWSPKMGTILRCLKQSTGVGFVYSRFVATGALLLALALEANGYTPHKSKRLLSNGIQDGLGRQCALCPTREAEHSKERHTFVAATYVLLTGDPSISPKNQEAIKAARGSANVRGEIVKVVVGSQIAGEGLDLRFIREVHILDAWFHLNKTEQIIGRGIRFCSHSLLPPKERNTTVYLHAVQVPPIQGEPTFETADLLCYRSALKKAIQVGTISRMLKEYSVDCNLRKDSLFLSDIVGNRQQLDSQGKPRDVPLKDTDYSAICDWAECPTAFTCTPSVDVASIQTEDSTYDVFSSQFTELRMKKQLQMLLSKQPYYKLDVIFNLLSQLGFAPMAITLVLQNIIDNNQYKFTVGNQDGYIIYKNGYLFFQPYAYRDTSVPMALRTAAFPVKRDEYQPKSLKLSPIPVPVLENEEAPTNDSEKYSEFWKDVVDWLRTLKETKDMKADKVKGAIHRLTTTMTTETRVLTDKFTTLMNIRSILRTEDFPTFVRICLDFVWDTFIPQHVQPSLVFKQPQIQYINDPASEQLIQDGSVRAYRWIDPNTNILHFACDNGKECSSTIREAFERKEDPVTKRKADTSLTGELYGYIVSKRGTMVFKTQAPHASGGIPDRGQECAIVTNKTARTEQISTIVELVKYTDPEFAKDILTILPEISSNSTKRCVLLEFLLRYMDVKGVQRKRWFFRPLAAWYAKHPVVLASSVARAVKEASEAQRKVVRETKVTQEKQAQAIVRAQKEAQKKAEKAAEKAAKAATEPPKTRAKTPAKAATTVPDEPPSFIRRKTAAPVPQPVVLPSEDSEEVEITEEELAEVRAIEAELAAEAAAKAEANAKAEEEAVAAEETARFEAAQREKAAREAAAAKVKAPPARRPAPKQQIVLENDEA